MKYGYVQSKNKQITTENKKQLKNFAHYLSYGVLALGWTGPTMSVNSANRNRMNQREHSELQRP